MARRPKTRVDHLADTMTALQDARNALTQIDLRTGSRSVREAVKNVRAQVDLAMTGIGVAIRADADTLSGAGHRTP